MALHTLLSFHNTPVLFESIFSDAANESQRGYETSSTHTRTESKTFNSFYQIMRHSSSLQRHNLKVKKIAYPLINRSHNGILLKTKTILAFEGKQKFL